MKTQVSKLPRLFGRLVFALFLGNSGAFAFYSSGNENNVILLVLDGVRWQDVYGSKGSERKFKLTHKRLPADAIRKGNLRRRSSFKTGGCPMSLPSYQRIFTGHDSSCCDNHCPRVRKKTFVEEMVLNGFTGRDRVAAISSWSKIKYAVETKSSRIFHNTGQTPFIIAGEQNNSLFQALNNEQVVMQPKWANARFDRFTFEFALQYLQKNRPRFLFIALNDADEWAHRGKKKEYHYALRMYDLYIQRLFDQLESMGNYGYNTNVIITADHGRGYGKYWTDHGKRIRGSNNSWLIAIGPAIQTNRGEIMKHVNSLADLRVLIEAIYYTRPGQLVTLGN